MSDRVPDPKALAAESYRLTFARVKADGACYHCFVGARMLDRLEHHDGAWGIAHRQLIWDWNHDAPAAEHWMQGLLAPDPSVLRLSGKFPADPVYADPVYSDPVYADPVYADPVYPGP